MGLLYLAKSRKLEITKYDKNNYNDKKKYFIIIKFGINTIKTMTSSNIQKL